MKVNKLWISVLIAMILGMIISFTEEHENYVSFGGKISFGILYGSALTLVLVMIHIAVVSPIIHHFEKNKGYLAREKKFLKDMLKVVALVVNADGKAERTELDYVKKALETDLKPKDAELYWELFLEYLNSTQKIKEVCENLDLEYDELAKTQFLYLIIGVATADGILSNTELELIKKIMRWAGIPTKSFIRVTKLFDFKREKSYKEKSQEEAQKERARKQRTNTRSIGLKSAYALLDISEDADESMIKSAYRALAKQHHPDRYAQRGPLQRKKAKEQFQLIADAYALIKENRGFK